MAAALPAAQWVVYDESAEECADLLFCCPKHGKQVKLASFPVSSYLRRVRNPRGQVLVLHLFLKHFTVSFKSHTACHFLHKPSKDESFIVWGQADERPHSIFKHMFCCRRSCHSNTLKYHHWQMPAVRLLNVPIRSTECSSFPYHKKLYFRFTDAWMVLVLVSMNTVSSSNHASAPMQWSSLSKRGLNCTCHWIGTQFVHYFKLL